MRLKHSTSSSSASSPAVMRLGSTGAFYVFVIALLVLILIVLALSLSTGANQGLSIRTLASYLFDVEESRESLILYSIRMPRALAAMLVGASMALAGLLMQSATGNKLASPSIFGVSSGAAMVVALWLAVGPVSGGPPLVVFAFVGSTLGGLLVFGLGRLLAHSSDMAKITLIGVAVSTVFSSLTQGIVILDENSADKVMFWLAGSVHNSSWKDVRRLLPWSALGTVSAFLLSSRLDLLNLGDETALSLGARPDRTRSLSFIAVILLTGATVSTSGPVAYLGLMAPHIVKRIVGPSHKRSIAAVILTGALIMLGADLISRLLNPPFETPSGVVTAVIGGPWLLILARKLVVRSGVRRPGGQKDRCPVTGIGLRIAVVYCLAAIAAFWALGVGAAAISPFRIFEPGFAGTTASKIVFDYRLPRIVLALLAGAAMAVSGTLVQGVIRNPLAAPEIIGITRGASLAAAAFIIFMPLMFLSGVSLAALLGGLAAGALVYFLTRKNGTNSVRLALVGMAVSAFLASGLTLLLAIHPQDLSVAMLWLTGSVWGRDWNHSLSLLPWFLLLMPAAWLLGRQLDVMALGDETATGLGLRVERTRLLALACAIGLSSAAVAAVGAVGFIGLMAPHLARTVVGTRTRHLIHGAAGTGMLILLFADAAGRGLVPPVEIPAGLITGLLGGPFFILLLVLPERGWASERLCRHLGVCLPNRRNTCR